MSKRFTCTDKWNDPWFSDLPPEFKLCWLYIIDKCDHSGFFKPNLKAIILYCDMDLKTTKEIIIDIMCGRIVTIGDEWFIPKFLKFQYPKGLSSKKPAIVSVVNLLKEKGVYWDLSKYMPNGYVIIDESLHNSLLTIKDKDKSMDKVMDEDKYMLCLEPTLTKTIVDHINEIYGSTTQPQVQEILPFIDKFPDVEKFGRLAKKIHRNTETKFRGKPLWLCQKVFTEYSKEEFNLAESLI